MNACQTRVQLMQNVKTLMEVLLVIVRMALMELDLFAMVIFTLFVVLRLNGLNKNKLKRNSTSYFYNN